MDRDVLGTFEYQVLSVLLQQPQNAYGTVIKQRIAERTGRDPSVGALYTTLDRLERKGFVASSWGEATPERGGRRKRFYRVEASGADALRRTEGQHARFAVPYGLSPVGI